MESNKLEISGRTTVDPPPASYKPVPESDTQETFKERPKSLTKSLKSNTDMDGADEQMLPKEEKNDPKIDMGDVKFTSNEKQNGDAKLDISMGNTAFVGMSKEELMKYANDPFWVRLRWILFVSFWLLWLAMLVGAVIIIIAAPKCDPPAPRTWYEEGPLVEVTSDMPQDSLQKLKETNKIKAVIVSKLDDSYKPINESTDLVNFLQRAKELDLNVIVELLPAISSLWFEKAQGKDERFSDYYIWSNYNKNNETGSPEPPNNWLSPDGSSAWKYSSVRDDFYYAPSGSPHLNFRNQEVINEFSTVIGNWIDAGAKGIRLKGAPTLLVNEKFNDEPFNTIPGPTHDNYKFYKHRGTTIDVEGLGDILKQWKTVVREHKDNNGPLILTEDLNSLDSYLLNDTLSFDLPRHSQIFFTPEKLTNASLIYKELNYAFSILGENWPLWQYDDKSTALPVDVLNIIVMLLPGSVIVNPEVHINPELLEFRKSQSIMYGETYRDILANNTVFAYLRVETGNPGYLVACNPSDKAATVDFTTMKNVSDEITVKVFSANFNVTLPDDSIMEPNKKISAKNIHIPPKSAVVFSYVPK